MNTDDLAYIAGFFDGEGCVSANRRRLLCNVANADRRPLDVMREKWGGSITLKRGGRQKHYRDIYHWVIVTKQAETFLRAILPFLVIKHARAALGIQLSARPTMLTPEFGNGLPGDGSPARVEERALRDWIEKRLKWMNRRGKR